MVLTTPVWRAIRKQFPTIHIGVAASFRNRPILDYDPYVDQVFDATAGDWEAIWKARKEASSEQWDVVMPLIYQDITKIAILCRVLAPGAISTMLLKPGENAALRGKIFSMIVPSPYRTEEIEMIEQMRVHLMGVLKMEVPDEEWKPFLYPEEEAVRRVNHRIKEILNRNGTSHYIHLNLEAKMEFREYGIPNSFELSKKLTESFPHTTVFWTASQHIASKTLAFLDQNDSNRIHYFPTESLHELIALVQGAVLVISPDTSIIHIASAFKRPVVGLYVMRREWPPYKTPYRLLLSGKDNPVSSIPVEDVMDAVRDLLPNATDQ
jgi:ADP-heptose:LPS heptosyltransferase